MPAPEILGAFLEAFPGRVSLACSFQKEEAVLLDMLLGLDPKARVFALDTHVLFPETYAVWRAVEQRYGIKVEPLGRALANLDGWITGLRRDQSPTRANAPKVGWDADHELWKANPLADWDDARCWEYVSERELPYNELHDKGYSSIGCTHCTNPGSGREGRWAGLDKTECGLHVPADSPAGADELASKSGVA